MIYKHKTIYASIITVIFMAMSCFADKSLVEKKLDFGSFRGYATLSLKKTKVEIGKEFSIDIRFTNESGGAYFYNLFFNPRIRPPAKLAIYNSKKEYIGDLLNEMRATGCRGAIPEDWTPLPYCYVGTHLASKAGYVPETVYASNYNLLPPGEYYLQMIYYESFVSPLHVMLRSPKKYKKDILQKFYKDFKKKKDLFSSNIVKIVFTRRKIEKIATRNPQPAIRRNYDKEKR